MVRVPWEQPGPGVVVDEGYLQEITAWREEL
jgi:hypothetical protein